MGSRPHVRPRVYCGGVVAGRYAGERGMAEELSANLTWKSPAFMEYHGPTTREATDDRAHPREAGPHRIRDATAAGDLPGLLGGQRRARAALPRRLCGTVSPQPYQ